MKKTLLIAAACLLSMPLLRAQIADGSILENNIIITDLDGVEHDVFAMLDEGKTVVLDLFATWCAPCWSYHNSGELSDLYYQYGPDGTDELRVFAVETDPSTPVTAITGGAGHTNNWDWTEGIPYPLADMNIGGIFQQSAYPYILRICPNRQIFELGQSSTESIYDDVGTCIGPAIEGVNPTIIGYDGHLSTCASVDVSISFQNLGTEPFSSVSFEVSEGGEVLTAANWTGDLSPYEIAEVNIGTASLSQDGDLDISAIVDGETINVFEQQIALGAPSTHSLTLTVTLDNWPEETSWRVFNEAGSLVAFGGFAGSAPNSTVETQLELNDGCHRFVILDQFGDGLNGAFWGGTNGFYELKDSDGVIHASGGGNVQFSSEEASFDVGGTTDLKEVANNESLLLFPNPTKGMLNLQFDANESMDLKVEIRDILGRTVVSEDFGVVPQGRFEYSHDMSRLKAGLYLVTLYSGDSQMVRKVTLSH